MADFAWQPMHTIADYIPAEAPVLFLATMPRPKIMRYGIRSLATV